MEVDQTVSLWENTVISQATNVGKDLCGMQGQHETGSFVSWGPGQWMKLQEAPFWCLGKTQLVQLNMSRHINHEQGHIPKWPLRLFLSLKECANNSLLTDPTSGALKVHSVVAQMIMQSVKYLGYCHEEGNKFGCFPHLCSKLSPIAQAILGPLLPFNSEEFTFPNFLHSISAINFLPQQTSNLTQPAWQPKIGPCWSP